MSISEDIARRLDPMVESAVFVKEGGQKSVFRFTHGAADWALKLIDLRDTERRLGEALQTVVARVDREVRILHDIDSPHVPKLGPFAPCIARIESAPYFAYSEEFVEGQSLTELIAAGALDHELITQVGLDVAVALRELWNCRIVHRDVKPDNIVQRASDGSFVLLDPGYALDLGDASLTRTGGIVGTAPYYSPEQLDIGNKRALDCRSDLYSLGIAMCEAITGAHPYYRPGMTHSQLHAAIRNEVPARPEAVRCPEPLANIIMRLVRKRPHLRYRSPTDLVLDIHAYLREAP